MTGKEICDSTLTRPRLALAFSMTVFALNDFLYWRFDDTYGVYLVDYASKSLMLVPLLLLWKTLPAAPQKRGSWWVLLMLWLGLVVFDQLLEPLSAFLGSGWQLFGWPYIEHSGLWLLDLTLGLMLTAVAEEMVARRLALAVLPGPMWVRLISSSLLFGLGHWGQGYGHMALTAIIGLAFGAAYLRTGSLGVVIAAHYTINLLVFGLHLGT
ncbi:MAG: CPBP family intramembrane metalloprotease [Alphaproteobacteria bacterium]|nr:CPBP family intramembrane metalloprotease [Alphaproteobacteria bacterium]